MIEYLWKASWCFHAKDNPAAENRAPSMRQPSCTAVPPRRPPIAWQADDLGLTTERRGGVEACVCYLANKEPCLGYTQALEQGWPIATGVVEGACSHLIADRFDITGSRWSVEGAEALLLLRAVSINGDFEEYWLHHIAPRAVLGPPFGAYERKLSRWTAASLPLRCQSTVCLLGITAHGWICRKGTSTGKGPEPSCADRPPHAGSVRGRVQYELDVQTGLSWGQSRPGPDGRRPR